MKFLTLALLSAVPLLSLAADKYPTKSDLVWSCESIPVDGDDKSASEMLDAINVYRNGDQAWLMIIKDTEIAIVEASVTEHFGGTTYSAGNSKLRYSLSTALGNRPGLNLKATFKFVLNEDESSAKSSSYSCK